MFIFNIETIYLFGLKQTLAEPGEGASTTMNIAQLVLGLNLSEMFFNITIMRKWW